MEMEETKEKSEAIRKMVAHIKSFLVIKYWRHCPSFLLYIRGIENINRRAHH